MTIKKNNHLGSLPYTFLRLSYWWTRDLNDFKKSNRNPKRSRKKLQKKAFIILERLFSKNDEKSKICIRKKLINEISENNP